MVLLNGKINKNKPINASYYIDGFFHLTSLEN